MNDIVVELQLEANTLNLTKDKGGNVLAASRPRAYLEPYKLPHSNRYNEQGNRSYEGGRRKDICQHYQEVHTCQIK